MALLLSGSAIAGRPGSPESFGSAPAAPARQQVYFLGVDHRGPGNAGDELARSLTGSAAPWTLTDLVMARAAGLDDGPVLLRDLEGWRPMADPLNVAVIRLRDIEHSVEGLDRSAFRNFVSVELLWVHVGQDRLTRGLERRFPEVRATISEHFTVERKSDRPLSPDGWQTLTQEAFLGGVERLLERVGRYGLRVASRSATELRFLTVPPARIHPELERQLLDYAAPAGVEALKTKLAHRAALYLENELTSRLYEDASLEHVVLLPNLSSVEFLAPVWPDYADRITALSGHGGAADHWPPRLPAVVARCEAEPSSALVDVHGWEVRSMVAAMRLRTVPLQRYAKRYTLTTILAGDVKMPLGAGQALATAGADLPTLTGTYRNALDRPEQISAARAIGPYTMAVGLSSAASDLAEPLLERIRAATGRAPSHPSFERYCHDQ